MKDAFYLFLFLIFASVFVSCSGETEGGFYESRLLDQRLELEKVDEFIVHSAADSQHTIGRLRFTFATNRAGNLHAFYDEMKKQFMVTDKEGEIQQVIGSEGRGPGELLRADGFNFDEEDQLVVFDQNQLMLKVFALNGEVVSHAKPEKSSYYISGRKLHPYNGNILSATIDNKVLANLKEEAYKSKLTALHSYDGSFIDTIGTYDPTVKEAKSYNLSSIITIDHEHNHLISTHYDNYRLQVYDLENKERLAWFGRKTAHYNEGEEYISPNLPREKIKEQSVGRSSAASVHSTAAYFILYFETLTESFFKTDNFNDKKPYLAVYDKESYDSYGDIELPYVLGNVAGGQFYLVENDNPDSFKVGIYELTEGS